jgi:class 3 adenylate cyclase
MIAEQMRAVSIQKDACKCLYGSYKSLNNKSLALLYYEKANNFEDSLNTKEAANRMMNLAFQKQQLADSIAFVKKENTAQLKHQAEIQAKEKQRNFIIFSLGIMLLVAVGLWSRLNFVRKSKEALKIEKDRSEALLLNILPEEIAEELKATGSVKAKDFGLVSILFTDFQSFTQTAQTMSPQRLVEEINVCFEAFDRISEKYQIEKIKTIGDAYMAAGGMANADENTPKNVVLAGLEMQAFIAQRALENQQAQKPYFEMRLGIHAGPIVAGIVGVKKFQYDIWGDTVNTASRMESNGAVGKVNISEAFYELIKDDSRFSFEYRGNISAKGKGEINMYFVEKNGAC